MSSDLYNEFTGLREDGRTPDQLRFIDAEVGTVSGCTGSSHFKIGQTEIIAQVFGPKESSSSNEEIEIKVSFEYAAFAKCPHSVDISEVRRGRESEVFLQRTFETAIDPTYRSMKSRSRIDICVNVIQDDGSSQAAAVNAITLALIEAGIPMRDFVVSISVAYISEKPFLDAGRREFSPRFPTLELCLYPTFTEIISITTTSRIKPEIAQILISAAIEGCKKLKSILENVLRNVTA